ncbi:MAG: sugar transferase [Phycisphaerae bacterium]|nr:sugar transferase [Phycisphaerae bacterium]
MALLIIDNRPAFLPPGDDSNSLLTLPLGGYSVLYHVLTRIGDVAGERVFVCPTFPTSPRYEGRIRREPHQRIELVSPERLFVIQQQVEVGDYLVVVEPRLWPASGYDSELIARSLQEYGAATHAVAIGADAEGTRELLECDAEGNVQRVQRYFNRQNLPENGNTAVCCSVVPARAVAGVRLSSLADLRFALFERGVLSRDLPMRSDLLNLSDGHAYLTLNERILADTLRNGNGNGNGAHLTVRTERILVGTGCSIDPSARLVPPLIIQSNVTIEQGATVIGPTVVGAGSRIGAGAVVAQSVLSGDAVVLPGGAVWQEVVCGEAGIASQRHGEPSVPSVPRPISRPSSNERVMAHPWQASQDALPAKRLQLVIKRVMDCVLSGLAIIVLAPLLGIVAAAVRISSPGPAFFAHRREQRGGKEFHCWKFRTMVANAHLLQRELYEHNEVDGPQFSLTDDPRVTRLGRWLRATNIDELPQLFNVFLGHMSLVGPRPSPFRENQICVPWRRARLSVRPGITGLWQVCRSDRSEGDFHQWIFCDMMYVRHFSLCLDLKILLATVVSLGGKWNVPLSWMVPTADRHPGRIEPFVACLRREATE